ncbi:MAG: hypothetical protein AAF502_11770 [Bacteroidota bacterium]
MNEERGKWNPPLDDQFLDKGWQSMESLLDEHMPVEKKRRFAFWWLFGGLLLAVSIGGFSYFAISESTKQEAVEERLAHIKEDKAVDESISTTDLKEELTSAIDKDKIIDKASKLSRNEIAGFTDSSPGFETLENVNIEVETADNKINANNTTVKSESQEKNAAEKNDQSINTEMPILSSPEIPSAPDVKIPFAPITADPLPKQEEPKPPFAFLFDEDIDTKPLTSLTDQNETIYLPENFNLDVTDPIPFEKRKVFAGLEIKPGVIGGTNSLSGPVFNIAANIAVAHKWSIKPEVGYAYLSTQNPLSSVFGRNDEALFAQDINPEEINIEANVGNGVFTGSVLSLGQADGGVEFSGTHSLYTALLSEFRPNRKFSFFGGPSLAYVVGIRASAADLIFELADASASPNPETLIIPVTQGINRLDPGFISGMAFSPGRKVRLELRYHHHFANVKKPGYFSVSDKLNHSGIQFSVGYRLK